MQGNQYHILGFIPATEAWEMPPGLERIARALVVSGRLRINADTERNFVRYGTADSDATFTARELTDHALLPRTRAILARHVPGAAGADGVEEIVSRLRVELIKARGVEPEKELRVARVLAQSAHPAVIQLLIESGTEIFVSYSHNVSDLLAVHDWQAHGNTGGLQSTSDRGTQVFISCAGDPFFAGEQKTYVTDGFPALARMVVIGGQELGHFADLIRGEQGIIGRYSLTPAFRQARRADLTHLARWRRLAEPALAAALRAETSLGFYDKRGKWGLRWWFWQLRRRIAWRRVTPLLKKLGIPLKLKTFPPHRPAETLQLFLRDMDFNLTPLADAYRRDDPQEEEAIACVEALARVPQQVHKWGHAAVAAAWPQLYPCYYGTVIAGCRAACAHPAPDNAIHLFQQLTISFRRLFRRKPGYYPD